MITPNYIELGDIVYIIQDGEIEPAKITMIKITEDDICRMKADRLKGYGAIIFMGSAFVLCDKTHKKTRYYPLYPDGQFTVVGNIHDNPELLEVTE